MFQACHLTQWFRGIFISMRAAFAKKNKTKEKPSDQPELSVKKSNTRYGRNHNGFFLFHGVFLKETDAAFSLSTELEWREREVKKMEWCRFIFIPHLRMQSDGVKDEMCRCGGKSTRFDIRVWKTKVFFYRWLKVINCSQWPGQWNEQQNKGCVSGCPGSLTLPRAVLL